LFFPIVYTIFLGIGIFRIGATIGATIGGTIIKNCCKLNIAQFIGFCKKKSPSLVRSWILIFVAMITEILSNQLGHNVFDTCALVAFLFLQLLFFEKGNVPKLNVDLDVVDSDVVDSDVVDFFITWQYNVIIISQFFIYRFFYYFITLITSEYKNPIFVTSFTAYIAVVKFNTLVISKIHKQAIYRNKDKKQLTYTHSTIIRMVGIYVVVYVLMVYLYFQARHERN